MNDVSAGVLGVCFNFVSTLMGLITITSLLEAFLFPFIGAFGGLAASHLMKYLAPKIKKSWRQFWKK